MESESKKIGIFPSPTSGVFTIDLADKTQIEKIEIKSIEGKTIYLSTSNKTTIDFTGEKAGIYFVYVTSNGQIFRKSLQKF